MNIKDVLEDAIKTVMAMISGVDEKNVVAKIEEVNNKKTITFTINDEKLNIHSIDDLYEMLNGAPLSNVKLSWNYSKQFNGTRTSSATITIEQAEDIDEKEAIRSADALIKAIKRESEQMNNSNNQSDNWFEFKFRV